MIDPEMRRIESAMRPLSPQHTTLPHTISGVNTARLGGTAMTAGARASASRTSRIIIAATMIALSLAAQHAAIAGSVAASPALQPPARNPQLLTLKERLGEKWTDEQRVDNCNVPLDKRGPKPRPDACPNPLSR
jgi:hypothetical protein